MNRDSSVCFALEYPVVVASLTTGLSLRARAITRALRWFCRCCGVRCLLPSDALSENTRDAQPLSEPLRIIAFIPQTNPRTTEVT